MATVQGAELVEVIIDGGESAKNLNRPGLQRLIGQGGRRQVNVAKLDRLTRSSRTCGSRKLNLRALGCSTTGFRIQHTWHARLLRER